MSTVFHYGTPRERTEECWAISTHPNEGCVIVSGAYAGRTLSQLWDEYPELFGNTRRDRLPLLTKIIGTKDDLSTQVHPNGEYATTHESGSLSKTEC